MSLIETCGRELIRHRQDDQSIFGKGSFARFAVDAVLDFQFLRHSRSRIAAVRVLGSDDAASVVEIEDVDGARWHVFVTNGAPSDGTHSATFGGTTYTWTGNATVRPAP